MSSSPGTEILKQVGPAVKRKPVLASALFLEFSTMRGRLVTILSHNAGSISVAPAVFGLRFRGKALQALRLHLLVIALKQCAVGVAAPPSLRTEEND